MTRRRKKPLSVQEARAKMEEEDLKIMQGWKGSQNDTVAYKVQCVVCGAPNQAVVPRLSFDSDAKYLCFDCQDKGWAWMGNLHGQGTIIEAKEISTVEEEAKVDGDYKKANDILFKSKDKMQSTRQNPVVEYKPIRKFKDDTLMLRLDKCKYPKDFDEYKSWVLWCDKNKQ